MDPNTEPNLLLSLLSVLGGLVVFLLGMQSLREGVERALPAGAQFRLRRFTRIPLLGFVEGTAAASVIHSGPVVITAVGFVNAGVLTVPQTASLLIGANVGTTLSLQVLSLDVGAIASVLLVVGLLLRKFVQGDNGQAGGIAMQGLGLLFLGLVLMRTGFGPVRDSGIPAEVIAWAESHGALGFAIKALAALAVTLLFQSSGATIAMAISMVGDGGITRVESALPLLVGAWLGGSLVPLWSTLHSTTDGRRVALLHVAFNVASAVLAIVLAPVYCAIAEASADTTLRQLVNLNTIAQCGGAAVLLPLSSLLLPRVYARLPVPPDAARPSELDPALIAHPEAALAAAARELTRQGQVLRQMLESALDGLVAQDMRRLRKIAACEETIDAIDSQLKAYLRETSLRQMPQRECITLQRLRAASEDFERVGDHIKGLGYLTRDKLRHRIWFSDQAMFDLLHLGKHVSDMLQETIETLEERGAGSQKAKDDALGMRRAYRRHSRAIRARMAEGGYEDTESAFVTLHYLEYVSIFDRMVRHLRGVARREFGSRVDSKATEDAILSAPEAPAVLPREEPKDHPRDGSFRGYLERMKVEQPELWSENRANAARSNGGDEED